MGIKSALATLFILLSLIFTNAFFISRTVREIYTISSEDCKGTPDSLESIEEKYEKIYRIFSSRELFLSLSVSHEDLRDIETLLYEIEGALKASDLEAAIIAKSRLDNAILHLGRLSSLNIESVL